MFKKNKEKKNPKNLSTEQVHYLSNIYKQIKFF